MGSFSINPLNFGGHGTVVRLIGLVAPLLLGGHIESKFLRAIDGLHSAPKMYRASEQCITWMVSFGQGCRSSENEMKNSTTLDHYHDGPIPFFCFLGQHAVASEWPRLFLQDEGHLRLFWPLEEIEKAGSRGAGLHLVSLVPGVQLMPIHPPPLNGKGHSPPRDR